jgi:hypothetical protein
MTQLAVQALYLALRSFMVVSRWILVRELALYALQLQLHCDLSL